MNDPIVDEVRRVREEHAARFHYDLWAIFRDIKEQQKRSGLTFVSFVDEASVGAPTPLIGGEPPQELQLTGDATTWIGGRTRRAPRTWGAAAACFFS